MTRLNDLLPASFKGIAFFVRSEALTEGGRRIVLHDYPNSTERYVEDLGQLPAKFSITAFVTGADYLTRADQLERALQEPGKGRLSMPNFGARSVFAMAYRKDASQIAVGEIRFDLSFAAGRAMSGPIRAPSTVETVYSKGDTAREKIADALENKWINPTQSENVITAQYDLEQVSASINSLTTQVNNIASIVSVQSYINNNSQTIVRNATTLKDAVSNLYQTVSVGLSGGAGLSALILLTRFGSELSLSLSDISSASTVNTSAAQSTGVPLWSETTASRVIRNSNRMALMNTARLNALIAAYEQAADSTFDNDSQLDEARKSIEAEHQRLMNDDTANVEFIQSQPDVRFAVEDLRLTALDVLDGKEQTTFTLTEINENVPISAFILSYKLYAESFETSEEVTQRAWLIRGLNPDQPSDKMSGDLMVLQS